MKNLEEEMHPPHTQTRGKDKSSFGAASQKGKKKRDEKMPNFFAPRTTVGAQRSIKSVLISKEALLNVDMSIARFFYDTCIPINAVNSVYFQQMVDVIAAVGPGYKAPKYNQLRTNLLGSMKKEVQLVVDGYRSVWEERGCTIMADGWQDRSNRQLIIFLVYCKRGTSFVRSVDASDIVKNATTLCNLFVKLVEWVGSSNIVHLVTDNGANYKAAGVLLHDKYPSIKWSPCAAHCLNLILGDIDKMELVSNITKKASLVTKFVYNHAFLLAWLRKREGWTEIVRPGPTHFATTFIALKSILEHQHDLKAFFTSKKFKDSRYLKDKKASVVLAVVLDTRFWSDCTVVVGVAAPLIRMLRIMDTDRRPSIGYVYDRMYRAKKATKNIFKNKKKFYKPFTSIVKTGWDKQLRRDIHAAAYLLNPAFAYDKFNMCTKKEIMDDFVEMVTTLISDRSVQIKCIDEVAIYQDRLGSFARQLAIDSSKSMQPDEWWRVFGCSAPNIQNLAIKILSQTSSSSGCERNWSVFERIHTKKRNRLEHQRLNDLVLDNQMNCQDPIDYESIDKTDFWVMEEEEENSSPILDIDELDDMLYGEEALPINIQEEENLDKGIGEMQETPSLDLEELLDGGDEDDKDYERTLQELDAVWASKDAT
ncbi:uncharacterized protein [Primulina eburnea]|uniref:uncharacterized protein n=1 Tax=Primulina eburnea TaxID=1245227 RepID=UPI003C6CBEE3